MNLQFLLRPVARDAIPVARDAIPVARDAIRVARDGGNLHLSGTVVVDVEGSFIVQAAR